jgi:hypothetical protein
MATRKKISKTAAGVTTTSDLLNENIEIDGKVETFRPTTLDQIWGDEGLSKYQTNDEDEYLARLDDMLFVDLQNHAREVGLRPDVEPRVLKDRLMVEFRRHVASYKLSRTPLNNSGTSNLNPQIKKILREGA